jgi:hypothetical protein
MVAPQVAQVHHRIEHPQIDVLIAVPPVPRVVFAQARHRAEVDVGVLVRNVRVHVVVVVVFVLPEIRTRPHQVEGEAGGAVHPGVARERAVVAVVLHVESDAHQCQREDDGGGDHACRRVGVEHQVDVGGDGERQKPDGFGVHLKAVDRSAAANEFVHTLV